MILNLILIITTALIDRAIGAFSLSLPILLVLLYYLPPPQKVTWAFFAGLTIDLVTGHLLGLSSLLALGTSLLFVFVENHFSVWKPGLFLLIASFAIVLANLLWQHSFSFIFVIIETLLTSFFWLINNWWHRNIGSNSVYLHQEKY